MKEVKKQHIALMDPIREWNDVSRFRFRLRSRIKESFMVSGFRFYLPIICLCLAEKSSKAQIVQPEKVIDTGNQVVMQTGSPFRSDGAGSQPAGPDFQVMTRAAASHEKVYLQLDRSVYAVGSTVRFRGFLVDAQNRPVGAGSKVLYLELDGPQMDRSILWRSNVSGGSCAGSFDIPYGLKSGMYAVRAFTSWMKNGKPDYVFSIDIMVLEITEEIPEVLPVYREAAPEAGIISFYPESGQWVDGIPSTTGYRVNFKVNGLLPDTIQVLSDDSLLAAEILPTVEGFGSFEMLPDIGKSYRARLVYQGGQEAMAPVPFIAETGYTLHTEETEGGLWVTVNTKPRPGNIPTSLRLVAIAGGSVLLDTIVPSSTVTQRLRVPAGDLSRGIVNLTLYDRSRFLLCQRLCYFEGMSVGPEIIVGGVEARYVNGETVEMEIRVAGLAAVDALSMAVAVSEQGPFSQLVHPSGIDAYLPVLSEIRSTDGIFTSGNEMGKRQVQDLLLCMDPEDHAWNYYIGARLPACRYDMEKNGYILRGRVVNGTDNEPLGNVNIMINVVDSLPVRILFTRTDTGGNFYAVLDPSYDQQDIILQVLDPDYPNVNWELENKKMDSKDRGTYEYELSDGAKEYIDQSMYLQIIDEVFREDEGTVAQPLRMAQGLPYLAPNAVIYPADFEEMNSFREIAENILPGIRFTTRNQQFRIGIFDRSEELWLESDWVFLNGVLFRDLAYIATLGTKDIRRIDVQSTKILLGNVTLQGFLSIYTVEGQVPENYLGQRAFIYPNEVLPDERAIWMGTAPLSVQSDAAGNNSAEAVTGTTHPDLRQTLLWAPDVRISGEETLTLTFQTSQLDGLYGINIQGITQSGIPMQKKLYFTVQ